MPATSSQLGIWALTSDNDALRRGTFVVSDMFMPLSERDSLIVRLVADYRHLTASQIKDVLFPDVARISLERCLSRLLRLKFLRRVARRPAGERGGSGAYVYELGVAGHYTMTGRRDYKPHTAIDYHALAVGDCYVALVLAERQGKLKLPSPPRLEVSIDHARADMLVHLITPDGEDRLYAIEVEVTRKKPSYILGKCTAYMEALNTQNGGVFPAVVYAVPFPWMVKELKRVLRGQDSELFTVTTFDGLISRLIS